MRASRPTDADSEARRLVHDYADLILRLSYTYLNSTCDAEDVCQDVLMKTLARPAPFAGAEHEKAWIIRVAINACKDRLKQGRGRFVSLDEARYAEAPGHPHDETLEAVQKLQIIYREAIYLHYHEGYSIAEIARMTDRSESAVGAALSRGRKKLRAMLERSAS